MKQRMITLPLLGLIAGTRAALGAGIALLLADRMTADQRRAVGWTLTAVGVISTIPLAAHVLVGGKGQSAEGETERGAALAGLAESV